MKRNILFWVLTGFAAAVALFDIIFIIYIISETVNISNGESVFGTVFKTFSIIAVIINSLLLISFLSYYIFKRINQSKPYNING